ncbi:MAG: hypothetical protein IAE91_13660 [Ignavibacteriaceae bacterium]|nr:hypothetical protein [Ignavibacteriaceae bacterium]
MINTSSEAFTKLAEAFLPHGILKFFDVSDFSIIPSDIPFGEVYSVTLTEKSFLPALPDGVVASKYRFKGYKSMNIEDFPIRGRKVVLTLKIRKYQIQGSTKIFSNSYNITPDSVKLTTEFAFF